MGKLLPLACIVAFAAIAMAGCTTKIETQQTEPFRIQLEGAPRTVNVDDGQAPKQVEVVTCGSTSTCSSTETKPIEVTVDVTPSSGPCSVKITVKDKATGETLDTRTVSAGGNTSSGNSTTTVTTTQTVTSSQQTVTQNIVVNVKGKDNLVVITEAQQGSAQVNIAARNASTTVDNGSSGSGSASTTTSYNGP